MKCQQNGPIVRTPCGSGWVPSSPTELTAFLRSEIKKFAEVVQIAGAKVTVGGHSPEVQRKQNGLRVTLRLEAPFVVEAGQALNAQLTW